ncbi:LOW QUALITY PROTEIN: hypothetical protein V2J09_006680 [Rumex salicifolius]
MGGRITLNKGHGPYSFRLNGQNCHRMGTLMPGTGYRPKFSQLYIYDTENEEQNRIHAHNPTDVRDIVIETKDHVLKNINEIHPLYFHLQYPLLLLPYGEDGFRIDIELGDTCEKNLLPKDKPYIINMLFKINLDELINDLKSNKIVGESKINRAKVIKKVISAELPDPITQPILHKVVTYSMMDGPCGAMNPINVCMEEGKCVKHYPLVFQDTTAINDDGFPNYGKNGHGLDNTLLLKYGAQINVKWCNHVGSIKYLFKYITKRSDRTTMAIFIDQSDSNIDEIKLYYNCIHILKSFLFTAVWGIFGFELHYRSIVVDRLCFHLQDENCVFFYDDDPIDSVFDRAGNILQQKLLVQMDINKNNEEGDNIVIMSFLHGMLGMWTIENGKREMVTINYIYHVPHRKGDILLNHVRGQTCYEYIRTVNGVVHSSFSKACYAMGLHANEKEYIDRIVEASFWSSAHYLRSLFAMLLLFDSLSKLEFI